MEKIDQYIAAVDELIEDENKIVTYKLLSNQFVLSANEAKKILSKYIKGKSEVNVVYTLTGRTKKGLAVLIVRDIDLEQAKSKLLKVFGCSPYSVQKCKPTCTALYLTDYDVIKENPYQSASLSGIHFSGGKKLSGEELMEIKKSMRDSCKEDVLTTANHNTTARKKPTKSITSMFSSKPSVKKEVTPEETEKEPAVKSTTTEEKPTEKKVETKKTTSGMQAFMKKGKIDLFAKQMKEALPETEKYPEVRDKKIKREVSEPTVTISPPSKKSPTTDLLDEISCEATTKINESVVKKQNNAIKESKSKKTSTKKPAKKQNRKNSAELPAKKRRRIQELSSSSEEEEEMNCEEEIIPPSPPPPSKRRAPSPKRSEKNPKKKKVLKSHTYTAEDGSMLTEKVWEEVSCSSESDNDNKSGNDAKETSKDSIPSEKKNVAVTMKKGKQSTLMGFFKKKS